MSSSEQDFIVSTSSEGSPPQPRGSTQSSPSQQVPQSPPKLSGLTCTVDEFLHHDSKGPCLRIIEQPQSQFRFRYKSEMGDGTHGCLLGSTPSSKKNFPAVELMNYAGKAEIKCELIQANNLDEHPHQLIKNEGDNVIDMIVPNEEGYIARFATMGIIHTAKKEVPVVLHKKYLEKHPTARQTLKQCKSIAKSIDLNIVRLKFSAYQIVTKEKICWTCSEPIYNTKSVATNILQICRCSRYYGKPEGGDDMLLFVEKVSKKNIAVKFFEKDENGGVGGWSDYARLLQSEVHHQYGIFCRTPPYKIINITSDVKVFIQLYRQSDGATSVAKEFTYKASPSAVLKQQRINKKRKIDLECSTSEIPIGNSIPVTRVTPTPRIQMMPETSRALQTRVPVPQQNNVQMPQGNVPMPRPLGTQIRQPYTAQTPQYNTVVSQTYEVQMPQYDTVVPQTSGVQLPQYNTMATHTSGVQILQCNSVVQHTSEVQMPLQGNVQRTRNSGVQMPNITGGQVQERAQITIDSMIPQFDALPMLDESNVVHQSSPIERTDDLPDIMPLITFDQPQQQAMMETVQIEDEEMIITDASVLNSDNIENHYNVISPLPFDLDVPIGPENDAVLRDNPMLSQGQPNVLNPVAAMVASNLDPNLEEFERFQAGEYFDPTDLEDGYLYALTSDSGDVKNCESKLRFQDFPDDIMETENQAPSVESAKLPAFSRANFTEIKKLLKEIYEIVKHGKFDKEEVRKKMNSLFQIRQDDGGTFLHMALTSQLSLKFINLIQTLGMPQLLNLTNNRQQTILHLAVCYDLPRLVAFLVANGCDPMIEDHEGNNAIHYAVKSQSSLESLLEAIQCNGVVYNLNAYNVDKQTALHLASIYDSECSARLLLQHGASYNVRDSEGRTPLHLATYDDYLGVTRALLDSVLPNDVDVVDGQGSTPLQVVCDRHISSNSLEIIKLLLEKKADPLKCQGKTKCPLKLAKSRPQIWEIMKKYVQEARAHPCDSEDEFHTADEGDSEDDVEMLSKIQNMKLE